MVCEYTRHRRAYHLLAILAIGVLGVSIYSNTFRCPFVFDDGRNITTNTSIRLRQLDLRQLCRAGFESPMRSRPVAYISFALNYYCGRYDVAGYHAVNTAIHVINGMLVYSLAFLTFGRLFSNSRHAAARFANRSIPFGALLAGLIFTAHPVQIQSVTYIVQRMNSMAVMFYLLALLLYIRGRLSRETAARWALWAGCLVSWMLALGSKPVAATLPVIVLLYEWYFFQDLSADWLRPILKYLPGAGVLVGVLAFMYLEDFFVLGYQRHDFSMAERVLTQFRVVVLYITLLLLPLPSRLNLLHHVSVSHSLFDPVSTFFALLLILSVICAATCLARRQRLISFCLLWFLVNLVIESSVLPLEMIFEHRLYLPMAGFAVLVPYVLLTLLSGKPRLAAVISIPLVLSLGVGTYVRNGAWQDGMTLWSDVISKNPLAHRAYSNRSAYAQLSRPRLAIADCGKAIELKPYYAEAYNNLAWILATCPDARYRDGTEAVRSARRGCRLAGW